MPPKSKPGEGIVIIVDVGPGVRESTENTFYSQSKSCLINILQRKIFADKCKDMVGIVLFSTDKTKNKLAKDDQYQHITVLAEPKFVDWELISVAKNLPRGNSSADWLDAIIVAMDLLCDPDGIFYSNKKVVLMTDFSGDISDDQTDTIINGLKSMEIEFSVIGPSIDDDDDDDDRENEPSTSTSNKPKAKTRRNWNGKVKTSRQLAAECLIKRIVAEVDGIICNFDEAIPQLLFFEKKSQRSANWNAMLDIGSNFKIPVVGRIKMKRATPATWKKVYIDDENARVISETSSHIKDEHQTSVEREDVISGYRYGTTLVPFGEEDAKLKYTCDATSACLNVLGFTKCCNVPLSLRVGDQVLVVTAKDEDEDGAVALSAIIQALKELDMVAITRKVYRKNSNPIMGALYPDITSDYECLIWIGLPFQEEHRDYMLPSLEKYSRKITDGQRDAIDQLITGMDLTSKDDDDDDDDGDALDPTTVLNPQLQHYFNCLTHRSLNPDEPLPPPQQHVMDILSPPSKQKEARDKLTEKLKSLFPTKMIKDYKQKKVDLFAGSDADAAKVSTSNRDTTLTSRDLTRTTVKNISTATPVQDFMAMLTGDQPNYPDICSKMTDVLLQMSESLSGDVATDNILAAKLIEAMKTYRKETTYIDPTPFNEFIRHLKQQVKARGFTHLWEVISEDKLGLISLSESLKSKVTSEEAEQFLQLEEETKEVPVEVTNEANYDDMLDDF